jgi:hypothetical protein
MNGDELNVHEKPVRQAHVRKERRNRAVIMHESMVLCASDICPYCHLYPHIADVLLFCCVS